MLFRNGAETQDGSWDETKQIITYNTCSFDSIFAIYASLYFKDPNFREFLDISSLFFHTKFTALVHLYFETVSTAELEDAQIFSVWKILNRDRNIILKETFSSNYYEKLPNLKKDNKTILINCKTGLGEFFAQLSMNNEIISSGIETGTCHSCKITKTKIVPFLPVSIDSDVNNIQRSIDSNFVKNRFCQNCKKKVIVDRVFNKILAIDIEPNRQIQNKRHFFFQNLSQNIILDKESGNEYKLCGVIDFDPVLSHFTAHVKRKNGEWSQFDDMKDSEIKTDETKEILPFMLFYITESNCKSFKQAFFKKVFCMLIYLSNNKTFSLQVTTSEYSTDYDAKAGAAQNLNGKNYLRYEMLGLRLL